MAARTRPHTWTEPQWPTSLACTEPRPLWPAPSALRFTEARWKVAPSNVHCFYCHKKNSAQCGFSPQSLKPSVTFDWHVVTSSFDRQLLLWTKMVFMRVIRHHAAKHACKDSERSHTHRRVLTPKSLMAHTRQNHYILTWRKQTSKSTMMTCQTLYGKVWLYESACQKK